MNIDSKAFGPIEIDDEQIVLFRSGILGFERLSRYVLLKSSQEPFFWLQSIEEPEIAFVVLEPANFRPDYELDIAESDFEELELTKDDPNLLVLTIVTVRDGGEVTANLQGPVIINIDKKLGRQSITQSNKWMTRHNIAQELAAQGSTEC